MSVLRLLIKLLYIPIRMIFLPLILLLRPTGLRRESIVASSTVAVFMFVIAPSAGTYFGAGSRVAVTAVGALLGYAFLVWGKEFEQEAKRS
jgi:hypothetical protein